MSNDESIAVTHEWVEVQFSYGGWIECSCGYRPESQEDMDNHIAPEKEEEELVIIFAYDDGVILSVHPQESGAELAEDFPEVIYFEAVVSAL